MKRLISILFPAILAIAMACAAGNSTAATTKGALPMKLYITNSWNFTLLGKIDGITKAELKKILGKGNVTAVLSIQTSD